MLMKIMTICSETHLLQGVLRCAVLSTIMLPVNQTAACNAVCHLYSSSCEESDCSASSVMLCAPVPGWTHALVVFPVLFNFISHAHRCVHSMSHAIAWCLAYGRLPKRPVLQCIAIVDSTSKADGFPDYAVCFFCKQVPRCPGSNRVVRLQAGSKVA